MLITTEDRQGSKSRRLAMLMEILKAMCWHPREFADAVAKDIRKADPVQQAMAGICLAFIVAIVALFVAITVLNFTSQPAEAAVPEMLTDIDCPPAHGVTFASWEEIFSWLEKTGNGLVLYDLDACLPVACTFLHHVPQGRIVALGDEYLGEIVPAKDLPCEISIRLYLIPGKTHYNPEEAFTYQVESGALTYVFISFSNYDNSCYGCDHYDWHDLDHRVCRSYEDLKPFVEFGYVPPPE
jgi:hypothetical protein